VPEFKWLTAIGQRWARNKYALIGLGLAGILLLVLPGNCSQDTRPPDTGGLLPRESSFQLRLQEELEDILGRIHGVGKVSVLLTLEDEQEVVYAINQEERRRTTLEQDGQSGTRETIEIDRRGQLVIVRSGGSEQPVVIKVIKPRVRGILIVAAGADNLRVRENIINAVQAVLDIPSYRISVQKGK